MGQIVDFFGAPQAPIQPVPQIQVGGAIQNLGIAYNDKFPNNQVQQRVMPQSVEQPIPRVVEWDLGRNGP